MSCLAPIRVRDRILGCYHGRDRYLTVPCGHCVECAREKRNEWFVRLWSVYCTLDKLHIPAWFVTVTIDPRLWPGLTLNSPGVSDRITPFVRSWNERLRYLNGGNMPLRFLCSEFGSNGREYVDDLGRFRVTAGALHFHGLLFGNLPIKHLQEGLSLTHGYVRFERIKGPECIRYTVKYATKDYSIEDPKLRARTFASPGLGVPSFYFGDGPATNIVTINGFHYRTPRYLKDLQWLILYSRSKYGVADKSHLCSVRKEIVTPFGHSLISLESASERCRLADLDDERELFYASMDPSARLRYYHNSIQARVHFPFIPELFSLVSQKLVGPGHPDLVAYRRRMSDYFIRDLMGDDHTFDRPPLSLLLKDFVLT